MADEVKTIRIVIDSSKAVDGSAAATRALQNIERQSEAMGGALSRMEKALGSIGGLLKTHLALAAAEFAGRLVQMASDAFKAASSLEELAEQMGVTAKGLQALQFVAVQNGASMEALETAVGKFSQKMGEAADGNKAAIDSLKLLGVQNLDLQGKLRPTEDLLVDVAKAISEIDDPARRAAAAVDFFGKGGRALLPSLKDMADGFDAMALKAEAAGAMISAHTIKRLDEMADRLEIGKLKTRAFLAEGLVAISDWYDRNKETMMGLPIIGSIITLLENLNKIGPALKAVKASMEETIADLRQAWQDVGVSLAAGLGGVIDTFERAGEAIKQAIQSAMNGVMEAIEKTINAASSVKIGSSWFGGSREQKLFDPVTLPRVGGGGPVFEPSVGMTNEQIMRQGARDARGNRDFRQELNDQRGVDFAEWFAQKEAAAAGYKPTTVGAGTSMPTGGGGETPEQKYAKLAAQLNNAAIAQDKMTAAALQGDQAFEQMKAHLDAQQKTLEIFGKTLDDNDPRLKALEAAMLRIAQGKMREAFAVATTELQKQNDLLAAQIRLFDAAPEVQARELAVIKATNEAKKAGEALDSDAFKARLAAVETGERLKIQYAELQKAQELWTAPLKSALESIQRIGADAFDKFLENGKFSFEELSKVFTTTIRRMIAEFLALATIRPVMSVLVNAVSPSMAQSMGLGSTGLGGIGGLGGSSGGGLSLPSWLGGGSLSGWLGSTISGSFPSTMYGPPAPGQAMSSGFLGDLTWGQGLGALAGAGMGAYQLLSGNGSTASTIGGISSILGAGLSLIPGVGPFLGPAVGILGNLIPGLFGQQSPTITNQTYGQLSYGSGGWYTTGGAWGPNANAGATQQGLAGLGGGISSVFNLLGGVRDPSRVWGLSATNKTVSGKDWSSSSDSTFLVDPSGNQTLWRMNEANMMDTGASQVARASILGGAVGEISANMRQVVQSIGETTSATLQELATAITAVKGFDDAIAGLNKTATSAEQAIAQIDQQFAGLYATANQYGLSISDLDTAKAKARMGVATDFGKGLSRDILAITDPKAAALQDIEDWRTLMVDNNKWLLDNVAGAMDQIVKIEQLAGLKRAAIIEQTTNNALSGLKGSLERLLYGDLSGAAPGDVLSGTKATYTADLAKAFTGDAAAAGRLNSSSADYMQAAASYYGTSSTAYQALRRQTIIDVASAYRYQGGQFGDIPAGYDVITGNSLGGLAPSAANANYPSLTSTNGWLGSAWSNATNAWLAANPASSEISTGLAALSQQMMDVTSALQTGADNNTELVQLFNDSIALWQRIALKIAA